MKNKFYQGVKIEKSNVRIKPLNLESNSQSPKKLSKIAEKATTEIQGCGLCKLVLGDG